MDGIYVSGHANVHDAGQRGPRPALGLYLLCGKVYTAFHTIITVIYLWSVLHGMYIVSTLSGQVRSILIASLDKRWGGIIECILLTTLYFIVLKQPLLMRYLQGKSTVTATVHTLLIG